MDGLVASVGVTRFMFDVDDSFRVEGIWWSGGFVVFAPDRQILAIPEITPSMGVLIIKCVLCEGAGTS